MEELLQRLFPVCHPTRSTSLAAHQFPSYARLPVVFQRGTFAKIKIIFELTKKLTGKLKIFVITSLVESDKVESLECRV